MHAAERHSARHTAAFEIDQPVERLFPLFSPQGERLWVPGWDYVNVMGSAELAEDYVFLTGTHDHASTEAVWIVKRYEPASHLIELYKVEPGDKVGVVTVRCAALGGTRTSVEVTYEYIALTSKGRAFVGEFTASAFDDFVAEWKRLLERFFDARS